MYRIEVYATGSTGNSMMITDGEVRVLIDAGLAPGTMKRHGVMLSELDAIFLTHDHTDHNKFAAEISNKYEIPVMGSPGTLKKTPGLKERLTIPLAPGKKYKIKDVEFVIFRVMHDAEDPTGIIFKTLINEKLCFIPETGSLKGLNMDADVYVMEMNHSRRKIEYLYESGKIDRKLYNRIASPKGHMSHEMATKYAREHKNSKFLFHHMSESNLPESLKYPDNCRLVEPWGIYEFGAVLPF